MPEVGGDKESQIMQDLHEECHTTPTPKRPLASSPLSSLPHFLQPQPPSSPFIPVPPSGSGTDPFTPSPMEGVEISGQSRSVTAGEWDLLSIVFQILTILTIETIVEVGTIDIGLDENQFIESENAEEELARPSSK